MTAASAIRRLGNAINPFPSSWLERSSDGRRTVEVRSDGSQRYDPRETIEAARANGDLDAFNRIFELSQRGKV